MIFEGKYDRAKKFQEEQNKKKQEDNPDYNPEETEVELEKGDIPAMLFAAAITFIPIVLIVLGIMCLGAYFLFS